MHYVLHAHGVQQKVDSYRVKRYKIIILKIKNYFWCCEPDVNMVDSTSNAGIIFQTSSTEYDPLIHSIETPPVCSFSCDEIRILENFISAKNR